MRAFLVAFLAALALLVAPAAHAQDAVTITLDQTKISTPLGRVLTIESTITNHTNARSEPMVAHVNVASTDGRYVDLEDWSATVTQPVEVLEPNDSTTLSWELQAVNAGSFHVYIVLLPNDGPLIASRSTRITVTEQRTLNAGGALPVAILVPLLIGTAAATMRFRVRRRVL